MTHDWVECQPLLSRGCFVELEDDLGPRGILGKNDVTTACASSDTIFTHSGQASLVQRNYPLVSERNLFYKPLVEVPE